jgi:signal peptidase I
MPSRTLLLTIFQPLAVAIVLALALRSMVRVYAIPSASMHPTLRVGDHIVVVPDRHPARGEVIVFRSPGSPDELMVKRIIAAPGDLIATTNGRVTIGSHALPEPYLADPAASGAIQPQIVPAGCYYVLGDNRANSWDSRSWGVLPRDLVVGRAVMVLWSSGDGTDSDPHVSASTVAPSAPEHSLRFERLFKRIR